MAKAAAKGTSSVRTFGFVIMIKAKDEVDCQDIQAILEQAMFHDPTFEDVTDITVGPLGEVEFDKSK